MKITWKMAMADILPNGCYLVSAKYAKSVVAGHSGALRIRLLTLDESAEAVYTVVDIGGIPEDPENAAPEHMTALLQEITIALAETREWKDRRGYEREGTVAIVNMEHGQAAIAVLGGVEPFRVGDRVTVRHIY